MNITKVIKYKNDVEWIKKVIDIQDTTYDLLLDVIVENLISKYDKALDMLLDLSVDKESGICCTYGCPNKDEDIESGSCIGKCMTKQELKDYLLKQCEVKQND